MLFYASGKTDYDRLFEDWKGASLRELKYRGDTCLSDGRVDSALVYYTMAVSKYRSDSGKEDAELCAGALNNAGYLYMFSYNNYPLAYSSLLKALSISEEYGCKDIEPCIYLNIGNIYTFYDDNRAAMGYYRKSFYAAIETKDWTNLLTVFTNLVSTAIQDNCTDSIAKEAVAFRQLGVPRMPMLAYSRAMGAAAESLIRGDDDEAVRQLRKSVGMVDSKLTPERFKLLTRLLIVVVYKNNGHLEESLAEALEVERLARGVAIDIQEQACRQIVALCRKTHRADSALVWGERQLALRDSIFSHQQYSRIRDLDTSYEIQKVDAKLQQSENRRYTAMVAMTVMGVSSVVICLLALLIYKKNRRLNRRNHDLYRRNVEMMRLSENENRLRTTYEQRIAECEQEIERLSKKDVLRPVAREQRSSVMDEDMRQSLLEKISRVMNDVGEISQNEFSIDRLSKLVGSNSHYVSQLINDTYGKNFSLLLGESRVRQACKRLCDTDSYGNLTIEAIASGLGFKSRSNFITVFKRVTGLTPSEYKKISKEKTT